MNESLLGLLLAVSPQVPPAQPKAVPVVERVWAQLQGGPVPRAYVDGVFQDPRLAILQEVLDRVAKPGEALPYERYRLIFMTEARIAAGADFVAAQGPLLRRVKARYGVDPLLLASLVGVETFYGRAAGKHPVVNALYTLADRVPGRQTFADRELAEALKLLYAEGRDPFSLLGSYAGAFGFGQFIPSTFNRHAVDFDGDGRRTWDEWPDVLGSIANYLVANGYAPSDAGTRRAIYAYNHSDNYVRVVLELREAIRARSSAASARRARARDGRRA